LDLGLAGKTALVTGSNRGTGEIIANSLAAEGATVLRHTNQDQQPEADRDILWGDLASEQGCQQVLQQLQQLLQQQGASIDILVNNYGTTDRHNWEDSNTEKWLQMYQVNVLSAARISQGLVAAMKQQGWGRIINLGTIGSHQPNSIMPAYYAAKGALATMGVSLAKELSHSGVTVNTVSPGYIRTPEVEQAYRRRGKKLGWGEDWSDIVKQIVATDFPNPCGRIAEREEVADLVMFLCSERAGFINGQNIRIDGGAVSYV
jgi:NAD(P)-dependent dehydrogenase (short-subunit alcohol dehydrogenase family)